MINSNCTKHHTVDHFFIFDQGSTNGSKFLNFVLISADYFYHFKVWITYQPTDNIYLEIIKKIEKWIVTEFISIKTKWKIKHICQNIDNFVLNEIIL